MSDDKPYPKTADGMPRALEAVSGDADGRRFSPSTARNKDAVRSAFLEYAARAGRVLEIGSGTGEHGAHITAAAPGLEWTYSDYDDESRDSQSAWASHAEHDRLKGPFSIDAAGDHWGEAENAAPYDAVFCANVIHISPFKVAKGLVAGAGRLLSPEGCLFLYGPFSRDGVIAPSNQRFSEDLKRRNPEWGVRDLDLDLMPLAEAAGLALSTVVEMPANNLSVIFRRLKGPDQA